MLQPDNQLEHYLRLSGFGLMLHVDQMAALRSLIK